MSCTFSILIGLVQLQVKQFQEKKCRAWEIVKIITPISSKLGKLILLILLLPFIIISLSHNPSPKAELLQSLLSGLFWYLERHIC